MLPVQVLIVEDSEPFRRAAVAVVRATPPFVVAGVVESGEDCLRSVAVLHPDLVLIDVGLPGIDGVETARRLAAGAERPAVVLVSTHPQEEFTERLAGCGALAYIDKAAFGTKQLEAAWAMAVTGTARRTSSMSSERTTST